MNHTPASAALAARSILTRTSRIAGTWPEYWEQQKHLESIPPHARPWDTTWANAWQAYRLTSEQLHGPQAQLTDEQDREVQLAVQVAMPELFAEYWEGLPK